MPNRTILAASVSVSGNTTASSSRPDAKTESAPATVKNKAITPNSSGLKSLDKKGDARTGMACDTPVLIIRINEFL
ncbi:MAG: hypothetical protein ACK5B6_05975 [Bacteroidia bacterium]